MSKFVAIALTAIIFLSQDLYSADIFSIQSGDWKTKSTWNCNCIPSSVDNVTIKSNHTVTNSTGSDQVNSIIIEPNAVLDNSNKKLKIFANYTNNGSHLGNSIGETVIAGLNSIISGNGVISSSGNFTISGSNAVISAGSNLTRYGNITIQGTVTNLGSIKVYGNLTGSISSTWVNSTNSILEITGSLFSSGFFTASAIGNHVIYSGTNQTIYTTTYYHLTAAGSNTKSLAGSITVLGDLTITSTLNTVSNTNNINIQGNFINNGTFISQSGLVSFTGINSQSIIGTSVSTFHNLTINKILQDLTLNQKVNVNGVLNLSSGKIHTSSVNLLTVKSTGAISGGSSLSFITGPLAREGSGSLFFPVGKANLYRPVTYNLASGNSPVISFEAFNSPVNGFLSEGWCLLKSIYWEGKLLSGSVINAAPITLSFGPEENIQSLDYLTTVRIEGNGSVSDIGKSSITGSSQNGTISSRLDLNISLPALFALGHEYSFNNISHIQILSLERELQEFTFEIKQNKGVVYNWELEGGTVMSGQGQNTLIARGNITSLKINYSNVCQEYGGEITDIRTLSIGPIDGSTVNSPNIMGGIAPVPGASSYIVEYSKDSTFTAKTTTSDYTYTDYFGILIPRYRNESCLDYNAKYFVRIKANNNNDFGKVTTFYTSGPKAPVLSSPASGSMNVNPNLQLRSTFACNLTEYIFEVNESKDFTGTGKTVSSSNHLSPAMGLDYNKKYYVRIKASVGNITSEWSRIDSFTTVAYPVTQVVTPANNAVNFNKNNRITATLPYKVDYFDWEFSTSPDFNPGSTIYTSSTLNYVFMGSFLQNGTTYYVRVKCYVNSQNLIGPWGNVTKFTTSGVAPKFAINSFDDNSASSNSMNIYPNPSNSGEEIFLDYTFAEAAENSSIEIFNNQGILMSQAIINASGLINLQEFTSNLSKGIYIIKLSSGTTVLTQKLVIK
jgi:hypothetical protein